MKNKSIKNKLKTFTSLIKSFKNKKGNEKAGTAQAKLQVMESDLKATSGLHQEVKSLKNNLKTTKKELTAGVRNLKKDSKELKKAHKEDKKTLKTVKVEKKPKKASAAKTPTGVRAKRNTGKTMKQ
jgi:DNA repair exonuclease SbcCD ATPase subunit